MVEAKTQNTGNDGCEVTNEIIKNALGMIEEQFTPPWEDNPQFISPEDEQELGVVLNGIFTDHFKND